MSPPSDIGAGQRPRIEGMTTSEQRKTATRSALVQGTALAAMGALHFVRPEHFDALIPASLPGSARAWTLGSGVAELGVAALLLNRRTRRTGGRAAVALYLGVWPGNFQMAWDYRNKAPLPKLIAWGRLPLQLPMISSGLHVARHAA